MWRHQLRQNYSIELLTFEDFIGAVEFFWDVPTLAISKMNNGAAKSAEKSIDFILLLRHNGQKKTDAFLKTGKMIFSLFLQPALCMYV